VVPTFGSPEFPGAVGAGQEFERTKECLGTVLTRFACKNDSYIHMSMTSTFCPVIFCLYVCIHGLFAIDR